MNQPPAQSIDLRSDTVTHPCSKMRSAMAAAKVGDDVYGDDPTVNELQELAASMTGKEAALFTASGTQANLIALLSHCQRGDEYLVGQLAHNYKYEGGGAAVFGGIQPQPLSQQSNGSIDLELIAKSIKSPDDDHFAKTRLISLENTFQGQVLSLDYMRQVAEFAQMNNLALHLDGARIFNASTALKTDIKTLVQDFDTFTICLSKGLGAPAGSLLCGPRDFIRKAKRWRKVAGGGMRQAGILAAAGLIALNENPEKLYLDHEKASIFKKLLEKETSLSAEVYTNMVFLRFPKEKIDLLRKNSHEKKIILSIEENMRIVWHKDVQLDDISRIVSLFKESLS